MLRLPWCSEIRPKARRRLGTTSEKLGTTSEKLGTTSEKLGTTSEKLGTTSEKLGTTSEKLSTMSEKLGTMSEKLGTMSEKLGTMSEKLGTMSEKLGTTSEKLGTTSEKLGTTSEKLGTMSEKLGTMSEKLGTMSEKLGTMSEKLGTTSEKLGTTSEKLGASDRSHPANGPTNRASDCSLHGLVQRHAAMNHAVLEVRGMPLDAGQHHQRAERLRRRGEHRIVRRVVQDRDGPRGHRGRDVGLRHQLVACRDRRIVGDVGRHDAALDVCGAWAVAGHRRVISERSARGSRDALSEIPVDGARGARLGRCIHQCDVRGLRIRGRIASSLAEHRGVGALRDWVCIRAANEEQRKNGGPHARGILACGWRHSRHGS